MAHGGVGVAQRVRAVLLEAYGLEASVEGAAFAGCLECVFRAKWDTHSGASGTVFRAIRDTLNMGA
jgi:hypothetical protein